MSASNTYSSSFSKTSTFGVRSRILLAMVEARPFGAVFSVWVARVVPVVMASLLSANCGSRRLDGDAARSLRRSLREAQLEHTVLEMGLHVVGLDVRWQGNRAREAHRAAFLAVH